MFSVLGYLIIAIFASVIVGIVIGFIKASNKPNNRIVFRVMIAVTSVFALIVSVFAFTVTNGFSGIIFESKSSIENNAGQLIDASIVSAIVDDQYFDSNECGLKKNGINYFISYKFATDSGEKKFTVDLNNKDILVDDSANTAGKAFTYSSCVLEQISSIDEFMNSYYNKLSNFVAEEPKKIFSDIDNDGQLEKVIDGKTINYQVRK